MKSFVFTMLALDIILLLPLFILLVDMIADWLLTVLCRYYGLIGNDPIEEQKGRKE